MDYDALQARFPILLIITHHFKKVLPSGLPEPDYNQSLEALDLHLMSLFRRGGEGMAVLVETFGGKRSYYSYVSDKADIPIRQRETASQFPEENLAWEKKEDPGWKFIRGYARDFGF